MIRKREANRCGIAKLSKSRFLFGGRPLGNAEPLVAFFR
jgi:hypothetical protein